MRRRVRRADGRPRRSRRRDRRRDGAAAAEADHPALSRGRKAGDHGDADARVDDRARRADARRGERRRERDPRRHVRGDALRRDGRRRPTRSSRSGRWTASHARSSRRCLPPPASRDERASTCGGDVERRVPTSPRRSGAKAIVVATSTGRTASMIARLRPRRPIVGLSHHQTDRPADGARVGRAARSCMPSTDDVEDLWVRAIETARAAGARRHRRPRRADRRHGRQPQRLDERDQGRRRLTGSGRTATGEGESRAMLLRPSACSRWRASSCIGLLYWQPLHTYRARPCRPAAPGGARSAVCRRSRSSSRQRIATVGSGDALVREARRLGLVKPGERLFIVAGIAPGATSTDRVRPGPGASSNLGPVDDSPSSSVSSGARRARSDASRSAVRSGGPPSPSSRRSTRRHAVPDPVLASRAATSSRRSPASRRPAGSCAGRRAAADDPSLRAEPRARAGGAARAPAGAAGRDRRRERSGSLKCLHAHAAFALARPGIPSSAT